MSTIRNALLDAVIAALPAAVIYFSGWAYLSSYLGRFGVDATQVDIPFTTVLVYSFIPLGSGRVIFFLAVAASAGFVASLLRSPPRWAVNLGMLIGAFALVWLLFTIKHEAEVRAASMADFVWEGQKSFSVVPLKQNDRPDLAHRYYENCVEKRRVRQIIGLRDAMYLLCRSSVSPRFHGVMFVINAEREIAYYAERTRSDDQSQGEIKD